MNKSKFVRQFPESVSRGEVVAKAKAAGIELTEAYVSSIRSAARSRKANAVKRGPGRPKATAPKAPRKTGASDTDQQFLSLVLELGVRRSEDLLARVKTRAAALV